MQVNIETTKQREIQVGDLLVIHDIDANEMIYRYIAEIHANYAVVDLTFGLIAGRFLNLSRLQNYCDDGINFKIIDTIPSDELEVRRVCK
jgi:hypothetical protein